jgi:hypothetical protein
MAIPEKTGLEAAVATKRLMFDRLAQAMDVNYWRKLNPSLSIRGKDRTRKMKLESASIGAEGLSSSLDSLKVKGWSQIDSFFPESTCRRLAEGVSRVEKAGWLPVFCFVYDEFWELTRTPQMKKLLTHCLGENYRQKAAAWIHLVRPKLGSRGWSPHVDIHAKEGNPLREDGAPRFLSVWIPLTNATLGNGCMYLLPADRAKPGTLDPEVNMYEILHATQAIPMSAGTVGVWRQDILHWGSHAGENASEPRISVALEFQSYAKSNPIFGLMAGSAALPTLEARLFFIAKQVSYYLSWDHERRSVEHLALASALEQITRKKFRAEGSRAI